jgi:hypothetical protein
MHIVRSSGLVTMVDQPGFYRLLAGLFALGGTLCVAAPWLVVDPITPLETMGVVGMGLAHIAASAYLFKTSPRSTVAIDTSRREIRIRRSSIFGVEQWRSHFHNVAAVDLEESDDKEASRTAWRPRLRMRDGRSVPLSRLYDLDRASQERVVDAVKSALG